MLTRKITVCNKCYGRGWYMYDENHGARCDACCTHSKGWFKLKDHHSDNNGKFCCVEGCGTLTNSDPELQEAIIIAERNGYILTKAIPDTRMKRALLKEHGLDPDGSASVFGGFLGTLELNSIAKTLKHYTILAEAGKPL